MCLTNHKLLLLFDIYARVNVMKDFEAFFPLSLTFAALIDELKAIDRI